MSLLFDDHPLVVSPTLAKELGNLNEAIFLQQLHYWVEINQKSGKNFIDGKYWVYNSVENWLGQFAWMTVSTLRRTIDSLIKKGFVLKGNYNKDKMIHTAWYSINYDKLREVECRNRQEKMEAAQQALFAQQETEQMDDNSESLAVQASGRSAQNEQIDLSESTNRSSQNEQIDLSKLTNRSAQNEQIDLSESANRSAQNEQIDLLKMNKSICSNWTNRSAQNEQIVIHNVSKNNIYNTETTTTETTSENTTARARAKIEEADVVEVDEDAVLSLYNRICTSLPKALSLTPKRRQLIHSLFDEGFKLPDIERAFQAAERSNFICGRVGAASWGRFDLEWLLQPSMFVNILEGKYDNIPVQKQKRLEAGIKQQKKMKTEFQRPPSPDELEEARGNPLFQDFLNRHPPTSPDTTAYT